MERGVTIDLSDLNKITVNERDNIVTIGPGNSWQNVYDALEPFQLAVSGGRWGSVGVGGLLTGGIRSPTIFECYYPDGSFYRRPFLLSREI
jgi:FAD/FMN-containing dehydrogenase